MQLRIQKILAFWLLISTVLSFTNPRSEILLCINIALPILFICFLRQNNSFIISKKVVAATLVYFLCMLLGTLFSGYSQAYGMALFLLIFALYIASQNESFYMTKSLFKIEWFYIILCVFTIYNIYLNVISGIEDIVFDTIGEKNYTGIMVYLLFMYSNKKAKILGQIVGIIYAVILSGSRSYLGLIVLFYVVKLFSNHIEKFVNRFNISVGKIFVIMFIITAILSYIWVYGISAGGYEAYHTSLNDTSNRMRFVANIKVFDLMLDPQEIWFWGYGDADGIIRGLGIDRGATYLGIRLVQSHNVILNLFLRIGILPTIIYYWIECKILNRYWNKDNYAFLIPYMINAIVMHSLFGGKWLLFLLVILMTPQEPYRFVQVLKKFVKKDNKGENSR